MWRNISQLLETSYMMVSKQNYIHNSMSNQKVFYKQQLYRNVMFHLVFDAIGLFLVTSTCCILKPDKPQFGSSSFIYVISVDSLQIFVEPNSSVLRHLRFCFLESFRELSLEKWNILVKYEAKTLSSKAKS